MLIKIMFSLATGEAQVKSEFGIGIVFRLPFHVLRFTIAEDNLTSIKPPF